MIARVICVALAICVGAASAAEHKAVSTRITVSPASFTVEEGFKQVVIFELHAPIICVSEDRECNVVVRLTNNHPEQVRINTCFVKWRWDEWNAKRYITITAHEDFVDDVEATFTITTEVAESGSQHFDGENPRDITMVTKPRPSGSCSATGDPHYRTFDGLYYHVWAPGRTVFYKSTTRDFEVQADMYSFHRPAVHCAVAAREGNNIVVVSLCADGWTPQYRRDCGDEQCKEKDGWPRVGITNSRNPKYIIDFESGARVVAQVNYWSTIRKRYLNLYATSPGADYKRAEGMCGNFDGNRGNDANVGYNQWIHNYKDLQESKKPKTDLFNWYPKGPLKPKPTLPPHAEECEYIEPPFIRPLLNNPDIEDLTNTLKDTFDPDVTEKPGADFELEEYEEDDPRLETMSEEDATALCTLRLKNHPMVKACQDVIKGFDITNYIAGCIDDAMETNGEEVMIEAALDAIREECADDGNRDLDLWEENEDGEKEPAKELQDNLCQNDCSGHGTCAHTKCTCEEGYKGDDCSVSVAETPVLDSIFEPVCASHGGKSCRLETPILGKNFYDSPNIACEVGGKVVKAKHIGLLEVLCELPEHQLTHTGAQQLVKDIRVTMDGKTWSNALKYTWYDATCQVCDHKTAKCQPNPSSCTIDGQCYLGTQISKENPCHVCDASTSATEWTFNFGNHLECGPRFETKNIEARIGAGGAIVKAGDVFLTLDAANELVMDDPKKGGKLTYSIRDLDEHSFQIDATTGAISTTADLEIAKLPQSFKNFFTVQATDGHGNSATINVLVELVETNLSPLFPNDENTMADVPENAIVGYVVGKVEAHDDSKDENFNKIRYTFITNVASAEERFAVNLDSGEITVVQPLNFEVQNMYKLQLLATDGGGQSHSTIVIIPVSNVEEVPTDITLDGTSVSEKRPVGTVVGTLAAVDEDLKETFTFQVTSKSAPFRADGDKLVTTMVIDFEAIGSSVEVPVMVTDSTGKTFSKTFSVTVTNTNEAPNKPTLDITEVRENARVGTAIGSFSISDPDGDDVGCTLTANGDDTFEISSGRLILLLPLDYEKTKTYSLTVVCVDDGEPVLKSEPASFTLTVTNANDAPEISASLGEVTESAGKGTVVGTVTAVDADTDSVAFTMAVVAEEGESTSPFALSGVTCVRLSTGKTYCSASLVVAADGALDHEGTGGAATVTIEAIDGTLNSVRSRKALTVTVTNVPEPVTGVMWVGDIETVKMADGTIALRLPEGTAPKTVVGQLQPMDDDEGQAYVMAMVKPRRRRAAGVFSLEKAAGTAGVYNVVLEDAASLDRNANGGVLEITVVVTTVGEANSDVTAKALVQVVEPEQALTWPNRPGQFSVAEKTAVNTILTSFKVEGAQAGTTWVTSVDAKNKDGVQVFKIRGAASAKPKLVLATAVDFEAEQAVVVTVTTTFTTASGALGVSSLAAFSAKIKDNHFAPIFQTEAGSNTNVHPDSVIGQTVTTLRASSPEGKKVTYSLVADRRREAGSDLVAVNKLTGVVTVAKSLKDVTAAVYTVTVKAAVAAGPSSTVEITLTVTSRSCDSSPCGDNGSCNPTVTAHTCTCFTGFEGGDCTTASASGSVGDGKSPGKNASAGVGTGGLVGIIVGVLLLIVLVGLVLLLAVRRKRQQSEEAFSGAMGKSVVENPTFQAPGAMGPAYDAPSFDEPAYAAVDTMGASGAVTDGLSNPMYAFSPGVSSPVYSWYKPDMTRQEATNELMGCGEGAFIVRDSKATPGWHMIGVKSTNTVVHEKIRQTDEGIYELLPSNVDGPQPAFQTIPELVGHYATPQPGMAFTLVVDQPIYDNHALVEVRSGSVVATMERPVLQVGPALPNKDSMGANRDSMYGEC